MTKHATPRSASPLHLLRRPLALAVALVLTPPVFAQNLPDGPSIKSAAGSIDLPVINGSTMTLNQHQKGAIVEWNGFNIASGYHVDFKQPGTDSVVLNRVMAGGASQIDGLLSANGRVFVVNPAGVLFGTGAQVSVGGLVASTLDLSNANFDSGLDSGHFVFNGGSATASVSNAGSIVTSAGGTVALLGGATSNSGTINAPGGTIATGGGYQVTLDVGGDGLTQLQIDSPNSYGSTTTNTGTMQADGGKVAMHADTLLFADGLGVVNQHGVVRARSLQSRGGVIELGGDANSTVDITGSNDAGANAAGTAGGRIDVSGRRLLVHDGSSFTAAGNGAGNGTLTFDSLASIQVAQAAQFSANAGNDDGYSYLSDAAISGALNRATDVTLTARGLASAPINTYDTNPYALESYTGTVNFGQYYNNGNVGQQLAPDIVKSAGPDANLTVNANRNIWMSGASIRSSSGRLNVAFNADSSGTPADRGNGAVDSGGAIGLDASTIATNGGVIAFYGQGDPAQGRATGSVIHYFYTPFQSDTTISSNTHGNGINLEGSTLDACVQSGCTAGSGGITLRGQGVDGLANNGTLLLNGTGLGAFGSTLRAGGDIVLDGIGGTLGAGVILDNIYSESGPPTVQIIDSRGNVSIQGVAGNENPANQINIGGEESGVEIGGVQVTAAGDIAIAGQGGTRNASPGTFAGSSHGVHVYGAARLTAGTGRSVDISGRAGSAGYGPYDADTPATLPVYGVLFEDPLSQVAAAGGRIDIRGLSGSDASLAGSFDAGSPTGQGGHVGVAANNILLDDSSRLLASGTTGGGDIDVTASNVLAAAAGSTLAADAGGSGNGGSIRLDGAQGLHAHGQASARGGATSGNGGLIETSSDTGLQLDGWRVNASAPHGTAGHWMIDPSDVVITHGDAAGTFTDNPFVPLTSSNIQDGDINAALDNGTSVTITTGDPAVGEDGGDISFDQGVQIERNVGTASLDLNFDAHDGINGYGFGIRSNSGALNMHFDSGADAGHYGSIYLENFNLASNGGDILFYGQHDAVNGYAGGITLEGSGSLIDTRTGGSDTAAAGHLLLRGLGANESGNGIELAGGYTSGGLRITTGTGDIDIVGQGAHGGDGVHLYTTNIGAIQLATSSGHIRITGIGSAANPDSQPAANGTGIRSSIETYASGITLQTATGSIDLRGRGVENTNNDDGSIAYSDGIVLDNRTTLRSGNGDILLTGSSLGGGRGIALLADANDGSIGSLIDAGTGNVILRAHNDAAQRRNPLLLDTAIRSTGAVNIRGGSVDADGSVVENTGDPIVIGATESYAGGINLSPDLSRIQAGTLILGSDRQAADVGISTEAGAVSYDGNLTLQAGTAGNVYLSSAAIDVGAHTLALFANGDITQVGAITAGALLASAGGAVRLGNLANRVSADTVAGHAGGDFGFGNAGDIGIGTVGATGFAVASGTTSALAASGIDAGGNVVVRSANGNLRLDNSISGNAIDLVTGPTGVLLNGNGADLNANSHWHVWASTWTGENRGGLAGSGNLPNLYGCAYGATCTVTPDGANNQFIYTAQPVATIAFDSFSREYGLANPALGYTVAGLILGDQAIDAISGNAATTATAASNVGSYAIGGNFVSPAGYAIQLVPGTLAVTPATLTYVADPYSRLYGDPNGTLGGSVTGFRLADTQASATSGTLAFATPATQGSGVGSYAIDGGGLSAANYVFAQAPGNATALGITPATLTYVANPYSRLYGDPNGVLDGGVTGFRNGDTQASATSGTLGFATPATQASGVGSYAIDGGGLSAANYVFTQAPGNATALSITPATLTYVADPAQRMVGTDNGNLGGRVDGFRNGDTLASATRGELAFQSPADRTSPVGDYGIFGNGLSASNYTFVQAGGNAVALEILPPLQTYTLDIVRDMPVSYVYDRNVGMVGLCPPTDLAASNREQEGDMLTREWARVRSRPNLANCVSTRQKNSCGDF